MAKVIDIVEGLKILGKYADDGMEEHIGGAGHDIARKLQSYYDQQFGVASVSVGIGSDRFFIYTHRRGLNVVKPDWLEQEIEVKHIGKPKTYRTS